MRIMDSQLTHSILLVLVISILFADVSLAQNSGEHTVKQGETLYSIARQYDITVSDLREWNDLGDNPTLSIGQILRLVPPVTKDAVKHIVQQGETLFAISRKYDVTIAEIQQWNNIQSPELSIGMELMLYPGDSSAEAALPTENRNLIDAERTSLLDDASTRSTGYYIVRSGDSLSKIAREHNMTVDELKRLNNLQNDLIRVGQQLTVRESISAPSVADAGDNLESSPQGKFVNYTVSSGETLSDILTNFEMTKEELAALNPGAEISEINRGQRLTVLLPPVRYFANPYKKRSGQQNLGMINALKYPENNFAGTTTSGELYNPEQLTAAHSNMALGTVVYVENPENKRGVFVKINDRFSGDGIKLSEKAFDMLKFSKTDTPVVSIYQD